jgi:hypothetical protein
MFRIKPFFPSSSFFAAGLSLFGFCLFLGLSSCNNEDFPDQANSLLLTGAPFFEITSVEEQIPGSFRPVRITFSCIPVEFAVAEGLENLGKIIVIDASRTLEFEADRDFFVKTLQANTEYCFDLIYQRSDNVETEVESFCVEV